MQHKPWRISNKYPNYTYKYFVEKWREVMINNLSQLEIKKYFTDFYREKIPSSENINFYWYQENIINFGDQITKYLVKKVSGINIKNIVNPNRTKQTVLLGVGSIMRLCNKNTIIWGSGIRDKDQSVNNGKIIRSVRGPLTRERLIKNGYECPPIYGDPGLLLSKFYIPTVEKKYNLGIIPHYSQYQKVYEIYEKEFLDGEVNIIDLRTDDIESTVNKILSCKNIVSSSLHGIVVANSYDIPVRWIKFDNNIYGDDTKYYDHYLSIGIDNEKYIDAINYKKISINSLINSIKYYKISINLDRLIESSYFNNNNISKYIRYNL
jgi:hypothetical protein